MGPSLSLSFDMLTHVFMCMTNVFGPISRHMSVKRNQCVKGQRQTE